MGLVRLRLAGHLAFKTRFPLDLLAQYYEEAQKKTVGWNFDHKLMSAILREAQFAFWLGAWCSGV